MPIAVACSRCGSVTRFADNDAGLAASCTACGTLMRIPVPAAPPAPTVPPEPAPAPPAPAPAPNPGRAPEVDPPPSAPAAASSGRSTLRWAGMLLILAGALALAVLVIFRPPHRPGNPGPLASAATATASAPATAPIQAPGSGPAAAPAPPATLPAPPVAPPAPPVMGFVGLDSVECQAGFRIDSYDSATGPYDASASTAEARVYSASRVLMLGDGRLKGHVYAARQAKVDISTAIRHTGDRYVWTPTDPPPPPDLAALRQRSNNDRLPARLFQNGSLVAATQRPLLIPEGLYVVNDLLVSPGARLELAGPVTLVVAGRLQLSGTLRTFNQRPANLKIQVASEQGALIAQNADYHLVLEAPRCTVDVAGAGNLSGAIYCRKLRIAGSRMLHFDVSLLPPAQRRP